jgi:hypothetical protein
VATVESMFAEIGLLVLEGDAAGLAAKVAELSAARGGADVPAPPRGPTRPEAPAHLEDPAGPAGLALLEGPVLSATALEAADEREGEQDERGSKGAHVRTVEREAPAPLIHSRDS